MRRTPWIVYTWPGLPQIWRHGSWFGLIVAVMATGLLNFVLVADFGFSELVTADMRKGLWAAVGAVWFVSAAWSYGRTYQKRTLQKKANRQQAIEGTTVSGDFPGEATFLRAIEQYLRGDWFEAERLWGTLLKVNPRDIESRLMLATLFRHTKRRNEAAEQLTMLERFEGAEAWGEEIRRERELLLEAQDVETQDNAIEPAKQEATTNSADPPAGEMRAA